MEFIDSGFSPEDFLAGNLWAVGFRVDEFLLENFLLFSVRFNKMGFPEKIWFLNTTN